MIKALISAIVFILFLPLFILFLIIGIVCSYFTHMRNVYYFLIPLSSRLLMLVSFQRFSIKGQVPKKENGPYIFMFNHESMFDVFMLGGSIPYYVNAIGWEGVFKWPLFGYFAKRYQSGLINIEIGHGFDMSDYLNATRKTSYIKGGAFWDHDAKWFSSKLEFEHFQQISEVVESNLSRNQYIFEIIDNQKLL